MRDINRIDQIQDKISTIWKKFPDMRYFQFISFLAETLELEGDLFFLEDNDMNKKLDIAIEKLNKRMHK